MMSWMESRWMLPVALFGLAAVSGIVKSASAELPPLISREILFGNPERISPQLSPDGKRLAWIAPDAKNVLQVWVKTVGKDDDAVVTDDKKRGIREYTWAENSTDLLYLQDKDGDENWHVYGVDLATKQTRDLTPGDGKKIQARLTATDPAFPNLVLVSLNLRNPALHDVYRLDLASGALSLDTENPGDVAGFVPDASFKIRGAQVVTPDGGTEIRVRDDEKSPWRTLVKTGPEEIIGLGGFTKDGKSVIMISSIGSDTARVVEREVATGKEKEIAASKEVDAGRMLVHPTRHVVQAVAFAPGRVKWVVVDPTVEKDFEGIGRLASGDFAIVNRDTADTTWLVAFTDDRGPVRYYAWDRSKQAGTFLFVHQPKLEGLALSEMKPIEFAARDGLKIHGYLTLPTGLDHKNLPMVLMVHGGPWARDTWGYNAYHQWLANRGYAVLSVNFRGSTGYGKTFLNAGNKQWGLAMHDDLIDACEWAVAQGYAARDKIAIFGGSYGGYAALAGLTFTPDAFACAVDIVGPSNLKTLIGSIPPYWKPMRAMFDVRMGNVDDPKDAELIEKASPLFKADRIKRPLLIGQGANDPRVNQAESEQIVSAIEKNGGKVTYVLYPDEGHGFRRPENNIDFNSRAESFLARHLGGRVEPLSGERYPGSTAVVREVGR
ncbi:MAG: S9 family peptidase [Isosphaeraceae bacterium]|nr:S9 family peptidase [Isosphaeraceae bacterium]